MAKILALVDALGNLLCFILLPGQRHDSIGTEPVLQGLDFDALLADLRQQQLAIQPE